MKQLLLITVISTFFSCSKNKNEKCYECDMVKAISGERYKAQPCTDDIKKWMNEQKDQNGNPVQGYCEER